MACTPFIARCTRYNNVMKFVSNLRQPRYNLNIVESGLKDHKPNITLMACIG